VRCDSIRDHSIPRRAHNTIALTRLRPDWLASQPGRAASGQAWHNCAWILRPQEASFRLVEILCGGLQERSICRHRRWPNAVGVGAISIRLHRKNDETLFVGPHRGGR